MAKKEFSTDFGQKAGDTPLNYRILVEDPATGTEYWATLEQAQAILAEIVSEKLNADAITDLTRTNNMGKILSDTTYAAPWQTGFTIDNHDEDGFYNLFHKKNHGLQNGDVVEFDANGGTLPGGINAYNIRPSGAYYNVIYANADYFYITENPGSNLYKPLSSEGAGAWQLRKAMPYFFMPIDSIDDTQNLKIILQVQYGFVTAENMNLYVLVNADDNNFVLGSSYKNCLYPDSLGFKKHTTGLCELNLTKIGHNALRYNMIYNRIETDDFIFYSQSIKNENGIILTNASTNFIFVGANVSTLLKIRSIRAILIQQ